MPLKVILALLGPSPSCTRSPPHGFGELQEVSLIYALFSIRADSPSVVDGHESPFEQCVTSHQAGEHRHVGQVSFFFIGAQRPLFDVSSHEELRWKRLSAQVALVPFCEQTVSKVPLLSPRLGELLGVQAARQRRRVRDIVIFERCSRGAFVPQVVGL